MNNKVIKKMLYMLGIVGVVFALNTSMVLADDDDEDVDIEALKQSIEEKQSQIDEMNAQKASVQASKTDIQSVINSLNASKGEVNQYITELDEQVAVIQTNIDMYNGLVEEKQAEIEATTLELNSAIEDEENQYEAMKERIRFMYETGDTMYLELLLSADSFGDMLNKADYIEQLSAYDRKMLEEYTLTVEYVNECKLELEAEEAVLEEAVLAAEEEQESLNSLIAEKQEELEVYDAEIDNKEEALAAYNAEIAQQTAEIEQIEAALAAEKQALANATSRNYDGGIFVNPAPSYVRISSPFGDRVHPIYGYTIHHDGIDMAAPNGSPILAAYDGEVISTGYTSGMGNYIMLDHGSGLTTIYMHASSVAVTQGQVVTAGEQIGCVGTTGLSTGYHLHFGVRLNGVYQDPMNYLSL